MIDDIIRPYPGESEDSFAKRKAYFIRLVRHRLTYGEKLIGLYSPNGIPITQVEKEEIDAFWGQFLTPDIRDKIIDYRYYDVFKKVIKKNQRLCYYLPDNFYNAFVDDYYTNPQDARPCDDKNMYDLYFYDVNRPRTIFRKVNDSLLDSSYNIITLEQAICKSKDEGEVVLKVGKYSNSGLGVMFWDSEKDNEDTLINFLSSSKNIVCQEAVKQHPDLGVLNPTSINTIRALTFFFNNEVYLLSSFIRFGQPGSRLDNIHSGGLACGIDPDGQLKNVALDVAANQFDIRPQGKSLNQIRVPNYDRCVSLVKDLAKRFTTVSRLVAWDIAVDEKGEPLLIEVGLTYCGSNFHQLCNGPIFGDMTPDVLKDFFKNNYTLNSIIKSFKS